MTSIADVVGQVVSATESALSSTSNSTLQTHGRTILSKLSTGRDRLLEARDKGHAIADSAPGDQAWRAWNQSLPPIAFEIARDTKDLVTKVDMADADPGDDFS